jgi:uncharacterized protein involved in type VI secretion and phage assembly
MRRMHGMAIGIVIDLDDPEKLGRVRVKYPQYEDQPSSWARVVAPMAGKSRGVRARRRARAVRPGRAVEQGRLAAA